eukprot:CAMPEP_0181344282 /NCGR_PEP_ID=MMETSP1101-20121128/32092_1 /TAXON_ID=46948 /ORGANISM="Rhodomonas abbreviata, Strain Caron Lab Isolate" /LENGTH=117 /DNA_ID=CAMNT_0023456079 /DNA_START=157 /DNA_END=510 /DNA_ORIENTATION=-
MTKATVSAVPKSFAVRQFSSEFTIPEDSVQQYGRRKEEIDAAAKGEEAFNRDPIVPHDDQGTKENPIMVPSGAHSRTVGFEDPATHYLAWFNMTKGALHYVPSIGLYFKIEERVNHH